MLGSVQGTGSPSSKTVSETLALLQVVGGGEKGVKALLEKVLMTQKHNEQIMDEARTAKKEAEQSITESVHASVEAKRLIAEATLAREKLSEDNKISVNAFTQRSNDLEDREKALVDQKTAFDEKMKKATGVLDQEKANLIARTVTMVKREAECTEKLTALNEVKDKFARIGTSLTDAVNSANRL